MTPIVGTYRLQLRPDFDFDRARSLVPYLRDLGVSHLYLSPIMEAREGSTHGYDVIDPTHVSDSLGGERGLRALADAGLGLIVDFVPNHMAVDDKNPFWRDDRERFFDIDPETGRHRRFFDVDGLAGVRVEDPFVFEAMHAKLFQLVHEGVVEGVRVDHVDGLADPARYLRRLREAGVDHVWIEKILETGEPLRPWPIEGTTGYDFLNQALRVFVRPEAETAFTDLAGEHRPFEEVAYAAKVEQAETTFAPEVERLRRVDDVNGLVDGLARMPVYRTYIEPETHYIDAFDHAVLSRLPETLRAKLALEVPTPAEFVIRFQQTSGAVMAKGVEDTSFYRYVRLLALNEVGGDPGQFAMTVEAFHEANQTRLRETPRTMLAAQTHDTKRSPDVRSRLVALTEIPDEWSALARRWHELNAGFAADDAPGWEAELLLYQTLVGAWPISWERLQAYLVKAMREAKRHTNWVSPDENWEADLFAFAQAVTTSTAFLEQFEPFVERVALAGERISLGQVVLRLTAPGVPDTYQGDELWDRSLVDPDNRRAVDWDARRDHLAALRDGAQPTRTNAKLFVTAQLLALRASRPDAFNGAYTPIDGDAARVVSFRRGDDVVVAVPLDSASLALDAAVDSWRNVLEPLAAVYPVAPAVYVRG